MLGDVTVFLLGCPTVRNEPLCLCSFPGQNGLMLGVSKGFVDIVFGLYTCPMVDINHQDNDGNTALMIAAQAGMLVEVGHKLYNENGT